MTLKPEEYEMIRQRILNFKIPYQEIYNELLDHISTDIETKRAAGDFREVSLLLDELIDSSLGGQAGIENMARVQERLYRLKIHRRAWKIYFHHIWWKTLAVAVGCVILNKFIPANLKYTAGIYGLIFLTLFSLYIAVLIKMRSVKQIDNKRSLLKTDILRKVFTLIPLLNMAFVIPNIINTLTHYHAREFTRVHPIIPLVIFCYTLLYAESCYRIMQEEMYTLKAN
ncbi:hypothetical protein [Mucilaginibacter polytrichastri]|uniref:Uncharacterized protein n=1 Tax=Mucilaginibacter polytrichastri TaxID=1302689 RepID=A0A1Q5ZVM9_9SPHI|nr:hypothetical protein [Mucilaginibacter polytrichastri]OKS85821.1 hypothetical protein RG47T_1267 [Mucilaginibacter polytrichastri]SFS61276.1 hypothetical protein SAMN04487890_102311 [Mucilaginibacter polytrichastri]